MPLRGPCQVQDSRTLSFQRESGEILIPVCFLGTWGVQCSTSKELGGYHTLSPLNTHELLLITWPRTALGSARRTREERAVWRSIFQTQLLLSYWVTLTRTPLWHSKTRNNFNYPTETMFLKTSSSVWYRSVKTTVIAANLRVSSCWTWRILFPNRIENNWQIKLACTSDSVWCFGICTMRWSLKSKWLI